MPVVWKAKRVPCTTASCASKNIGLTNPSKSFRSNSRPSSGVGFGSPRKANPGLGCEGVESTSCCRALSEEQDIRRRGPLEKSNLFNAYFEPFTSTKEEKELVLASVEQYSLDQVIYRSQNGRLLDV